jgi:hypothetical protein
VAQASAANLGLAGGGVENIAPSIADVPKGATDMSRNAGEAAKGANDVSRNAAEAARAGHDISANIHGVSEATRENTASRPTGQRRGSPAEGDRRATARHRREVQGRGVSPCRDRPVY